MWKLASIYAIIIILFSSCEEKECVGCNLNPKIKIDFEASRSLELTDSLLRTVKIEIQRLVDSLAGELTQEQVIAIDRELLTLRSDSAVFGENYNLFRTGSARIDKIVAPGSVGFEVLSDTIVRDFALPVDMQSDTTTFYFDYHGITDTLQLHYRREIIQNLDGLRMRLLDIVVNHEVTTFDSVEVRCANRTCSNDRTTIILFF